MDKRGVTLIELLIVVAIIGILAAISIPAYVGQKKKAARTEAYANLEAIRVLEEQYFAEMGAYPASAGTCAKDNNNTAAIQAVLPGFKPGEAAQFSYCIQQNKAEGGTDKDPCFLAWAYGNTDSAVTDDNFYIDCDNQKNY